MYIDNTIALIQIIVSLILIGVLFHEYFTQKQKAKKYILILIFLTSAWLLFFLNILYILLNNVALRINWVLSIVFILLVDLGFLIIFIKKYKFFNKTLVFIELILLSFLSFVVVNNQFKFSGWIFMTIPIVTFLLTWIRYFIIMGFLINISKKNLKNKKERAHYNFKINKKNIIYFIFLFLIISSLFLFFNINKETKNNELVIYNWKGYLANDTIKNFEEEFGINVTLIPYVDDTQSFENIKGKTGKYDIAIFREGIIKKGIEDGLFEKLNKKNIPNLKKYIEKDEFYDPGYIYSAPYMQGTTGIVINTKYISDLSNSWDVLWDIKNKGKVAIMDSYLEGFGMALRNTGDSINSNDDIEIKKALKFLELQNNILYGYLDLDTIINMLISEKLWASQIYSGAVEIVIKENPNLKYIIPEEGAVKWIDSMVILKNSKNKYNAEIYINYIMRPEVMADISKNVNLNSLSEKANDIANLTIKNINENNLLEYIDLDKTSSVDSLKKELWGKLKNE